MQVIKTIRLDDQEQFLLKNRVLPNIGVGLEGDERANAMGKIRHLIAGNSAPLPYIEACEANIKRAVELYEERSSPDYWRECMTGTGHAAQLADDFAARSSQQVEELLDGLQLFQTMNMVLSG